MILFKPEHVAPILAGQKTQTRRLGAKRWNVGAAHQCRTRMLDSDSTFATVRIREVRREKVGTISWADAAAEGYGSPVLFLETFRRINRIPQGNPEVWVVEFERCDEGAA